MLRLIDKIWTPQAENVNIYLIDGFSGGLFTNYHNNKN